MVRLEAEIKHLRRFVLLQTVVKVVEIICRTRFLAPSIAAAFIIPKFAGETSVASADLKLQIESAALADLGSKILTDLASQPVLIALLLVAILSSVILAARQRWLAERISKTEVDTVLGRNKGLTKE